MAETYAATTPVSSLQAVIVRAIRAASVPAEALVKNPLLTLHYLQKNMLL